MAYWHHALQVQAAAAQVLTLDASDSFTSVLTTLELAVMHVEDVKKKAETKKVSNSVGCLVHQCNMIRAALGLQVRPHLQVSLPPLLAHAGTWK